MKNSNILLIEDDENLGFLIQENLEMSGFHVLRCRDGEEGYNAYFEKNFDLCLIDIMLPKKDGFTLAREIRQSNSDIPIVFLTAKSLKEDKIIGFKIGGDDYITKPFSSEELILRIQAILRRTGKSNAKKIETGIFLIGQYKFNSRERILKINEIPRKLTYKESELLKLLCLNRNQILKRDTALKTIWQNTSYFSARSMDVYISKLRKYLKNDPEIEIDNIHGEGYKLLTP